jgi:TPR repeat protein
MSTRSRSAQDFYNQFVIAEDAGETDRAEFALNRALRLGEPMAHHVLAYNEFGKDEPRVAWALRHYRIAAERGFAPSAWNLARYYDKAGKIRLYRKWMTRTAQLGDPEAELELANRGYDLNQDPSVDVAKR